jgi:hypothetical protein
MSTTKIILTTGGAAVFCALLGTAGWETWAAREAEAAADVARAETAALAARREEAARRAEAAGHTAAELRAELAAIPAVRPRATMTAAAPGTVAPAGSAAWDPVREGEALMTRHPGLRAGGDGAGGRDRRTLPTGRCCARSGCRRSARRRGVC